MTAQSIVGRDELLAAALEALTGSGVILAGPRGVGRSRLMAACAAHAADAIAAGSIVAVDDLRLLDPVAAGALREEVVNRRVRLLATAASHAVTPEPVRRLWRDDGVAGIEVPPPGHDAVAEQRGISVRTVDNHLRQIYRRLEVAGRADLTAALERRQPM